MLLDGDVAPGECEVVIGGEESDQAKGQAADGLGETEAIEGGPRRGCCWQFWRNRRLLAAGWRPGGAGWRGHRAGKETGGGGSFHRCHRCHNTVGKDLGNGSAPPASPHPCGCRANLLQRTPCLLMEAASLRSLAPCGWG